MNASVIGLFGALSLAWGLTGSCHDRPAPAPDPAPPIRQESETATMSDRATTRTEQATFAAGCFWGVEEAFRTLPGVLKTTVGYTGGVAEQPTYKQVCAGATGHAEAVLVEFNPDVISYGQLLDVFWNSHNPTTLNRQGPDVGDQYRSAIFCHSPEQEAAARASKDAADRAGKFSRPIVTQIVPAAIFWPAEDYHQQYLLKRGQASCHL